MQFLIDSVAMLIENIKFGFEFLFQTVKNILGLLRYLRVIQEICYDVLLNLPGWVQPFVILTITVTILYVILGSTAGGKGD